MSDAISHDRAQQALARGDPGALALFDRLLQTDPGNARLWLGKAKALEAAGDLRGARLVAEQIAQQAPGFVEGLTFLAGLRLAAADPDFAAPFRAAAARVPQDPNIAAAHVETLAGLGYAEAAAEIAAAARKRFPGEPHFALLEAVHAGACGEFARADAIFAALTDTRPLRFLHEARHRLRARDPDAAERLLRCALDADPWNIAAWALRGVAWRLAGDRRAEWLHDQPGLIALCPLEARDDLVGQALAELRRLHAHAAMPLGQSLRGGTQTRGILFQRAEPVLAELHQAIRRTLETYRAGLPAQDAAHPLLRHRDQPWRLAGSWSVRLTGRPLSADTNASEDSGVGDHHTAHIHPHGIISSALYLAVPDAVADPILRQGWLEIGRPPPDLRLALEPSLMLQPKAAHLALFPSTLYHGTSPFAAAQEPAAERISVAFDVIADSD